MTYVLCGSHAACDPDQLSTGVNVHSKTVKIKNALSLTVRTGNDVK